MREKPEGRLKSGTLVCETYGNEADIILEEVWFLIDPLTGGRHLT